MRDRKDVFLSVTPTLFHILERDVGRHSAGEIPYGLVDAVFLCEFVSRKSKRVQQAIDALVNEGDERLLDALLTVVTRPFEEQGNRPGNLEASEGPDYSALAEPPLPHEVVHQTFCGT